MTEPEAPAAERPLAERLLAGEPAALARAITLVENGHPAGAELVRGIYARTGHAAVVGVTGPPGVGKSTLIGALTTARREQERTVGVLSVDPSSPFTKGAVLGDRIRLAEHILDDGVFIRSMASRGALGGLAEATLQSMLLMDAAGKDDLFLETVGVGQGEIDIVDHADTVLLVLMPGAGDSIQALKAGIMEIPDVIVVNKADHPMADTMIREIRSVLSLSPDGGWKVPIVKTEAVTGDGIDALVEQLDAHRAFVAQEGLLAERRRRRLAGEVVGITAARLRRSLDDLVDGDEQIAERLGAVAERRIDPATVASELLQRVTGDVLGAMRTTGTCRYFTPAPVTAEEIAPALEAARFAPQGGNLQPVRWVVVRDRGLMGTLGAWYLELWEEYSAELAGGERGVGAPAAGVRAADDFARAFGSLPALVVVCAKASALYATDEELGRLSVVGGASIYPSVQNFCLACRALELGTAVTTLLCRREPEVRELLGIPENMLTAAHVAVGRPARPWPARLNRRPVSETAFLDRYGDALPGA